ncbi:InlB B-repeat-containing protein [Prevotella sp. E2-28]|nr:InlB B-repeat-containing protein [Prevotella sp. E2-28]
MSPIGANIIEYSWAGHTPFSELDKTIDITSGEPRVAILITGHVQSATCPAPGKEHYWGLYRYTNPVKVTYNLGGGSVSGSTADKVEYLFSGDALATTFAAPTREGYTFDGWYTSAEGGTKLTASNATSATTIYAHWNAIAE